MMPTWEVHGKAITHIARTTHEYAIDKIILFKSNLLLKTKSMMDRE